MTTLAVTSLSSPLCQVRSSQARWSQSSRSVLRAEIRWLPPAHDLEPFECICIRIQGTRADTAIQGYGEAGGIFGDSFLRRILAFDGTGRATASICRRSPKLGAIINMRDRFVVTFSGLGPSHPRYPNNLAGTKIEQARVRTIRSSFLLERKLTNETIRRRRQSFSKHDKPRDPTALGSDPEVARNRRPACRNYVKGLGAQVSVMLRMVAADVKQVLDDSGHFVP